MEIVVDVEQIAGLCLDHARKSGRHVIHLLEKLPGLIYRVKLVCRSRFDKGPERCEVVMLDLDGDALWKVGGPEPADICELRSSSCFCKAMLTSPISKSSSLMWIGVDFSFGTQPKEHCREEVLEEVH